MSTAPEALPYVRHVVDILQQPSWTALAQGSRPWLCLNGAHSETLEDELQAVTKRFDHLWAWRHTDYEYAPPGYRQGPLLVALDAPLFTYALAHWLPQKAGLILQGPESQEALAQQIQRLRALVPTDGYPIAFSLHATRTLEELCEGLPTDSLAELFGPIHRFVWYAGDVHSGEWLCANAPSTPAPATSNAFIALTEDDEAGLNRATLAWFMRDCAREFRQRFPAYDHPDNEPLLWQHLTHFANEATEQLGLSTERDVRHYMALRFAYSHESFTKDPELKRMLMAKEVDGKQRLFAAEDHLIARNAPR